MYHQHRIPLVLLFRSLLALTVVYLTNEGGRLVALGREEPSSTRILVQAAALHGLVHLPALCVGLPLPFWLQLGWVLGRTAIFCLGGASQGEEARQVIFCLQDRRNRNSPRRGRLPLKPSPIGGPAPDTLAPKALVCMEWARAFLPEYWGPGMRLPDTCGSGFMWGLPPRHTGLESHCGQAMVGDVNKSHPFG
jgi:hypothetical protein